jgi:uncharacterized protein
MWKKIRGKMIDLLIGLVLIYLGLIVVFYFKQTKLIFPATRGIAHTRASYDWTFEEHMLPVEGEETLLWYVPLEDARGTVLFSHGNAGNIGDRLGSMDLLRSFGFSVVCYDYGGYGKSTGKPSEKRCYADIRAVWAWLTETRGIDPREILLFGRSLGGGVTAQLASEVKPGAIILESTFRSTPAVAHDLFPFLPATLVLTHQFRTEEKVGDFKAPILIIHSPEDDIIAYHHGTTLFEKAAEPKTFLEIHGSHNDGFALSRDVYQAGWETFLEPLFPGSP